MKRPTKVHCLFEQSGTFKNEFIKLGIPAEDYDIQNNFGQTDHVIDLFAEIEAAYDGRPSIFDGLSTDHLALAFFPCIYFCEKSQLAFSWSYVNYRKLTTKEKSDKIIERSRNREMFFRIATSLVTVAQTRGIRLIMENPIWGGAFLKNNFPLPPSIIDHDRTRRGDYFHKPTAYWFINCEPTRATTTQKDKEVKTIASSASAPRAGLCSEERSMISSDYARNFVADFILGEPIGNHPQQQEFAL